MAVTLLINKKGQQYLDFAGEEDAWDFNGADTQYATHGLHTYLAAMIPPLARRLIATYAPPGGTILDPFSGGGSVLVEAVLNGREAVGRDINHLAVLISKAKTTYIEPSRILSTGNAILKRAREGDFEPLSFSQRDYIDFWFKPYMIQPLSALRYAIDEISKNATADVYDLFRVIYSATVRRVSLTYRNEIRLRRMTEEEQDDFNPDITGEFENRMRHAANRMSLLPRGGKAYVERGDVRAMPFAEGEVDIILCSPPYGDERNGVPYTQFSRNMLLWLGYQREEIHRSKRDGLGWHKEGKTVPPSTTLLETLEAIHENATAVREAIAFYADYYEALQEMARVISKRVIIVIGQRVLHNTVFDNAQITQELAGQVGLDLEATHFRKLPTKRLPKMRQYGAAIDRESILVFRKYP